MNLKLLTQLGMIFVLLATANSVWATGVPTFNLPLLVQSADEVVVGKAINIREVGTSVMAYQGSSLTVNTMDAEITVERVLKGDAASEIHTVFLVPHQSIGYHSIPRGLRRIFLLRRTGSILQPVSPYYPSLPVGYAPNTGGHEEATVLDDVISYMAGALDPPYIDLASRQQALWLLHFIDSPIPVAALRASASRDPDTSVRLGAAGLLLTHGDMSVLPIIEQVLLNPNSFKITPYWKRDEVVQNLSSALASVRDERAIPTLNEILKSPDARARRGAASALRNTQSPKALAPLSSVLRDPDFQVRYMAVIGLAEITGENDWRPLMDTFKADEAKYIEHWETETKNR